MGVEGKEAMEPEQPVAEGGEGGGPSSVSPFGEDAGFNYQRGFGARAPFPNTLEAKPNEMVLKISHPDLFPGSQMGEAEGDTLMGKRIGYCKGLVRWMVVEAGVSTHV